MNISLKLSDKIVLIILLIIINTFLLIALFSKKAEVILLNYASFKLTTIVNSIIDNSIREILYEQDYNDLIIDNKSRDSDNLNLDFNNSKINNILYLVNENILESLLSLEKADNNFKTDNNKLNKKIFYIPFGVIYNTPILNNFGPKVPFKIEIIGNVNNETSIEVKEYGINSSLIELLMNVQISLKVILPFKSKTVSVSKSIILDSKIIQGKVPDYYGGIISAH